MLEKMLWEQLQQANQTIRQLQAQVGMVLDRQFYRPIIAPQKDIEGTPREDNPEYLSDSPAFDDKMDQAIVDKEISAQADADRKLALELEREYAEIEREQAETHAEMAS